MANRFTVEKGLGVLILLTLVAIGAERSILKTSLTLDADDGQVDHYSDAQEGGTSESEILDRDGMAWRCKLGGEKNYPYCGFELILDPGRLKGVDLRHVERVKLWLDYEGPTPSIRFYLRNHDPAYSSPEILDSTKYNLVAFDAELAKGSGPIEFPMQNFFVANWWFERFGLNPEFAHPQFDNIVILEIQTGNNHQLGEHRFRLEKVEFIGQVLSRETWYQGIMATWLVLALGFLGFRSVKLSRELHRKSQRERELMEINALLDSRGQALEEKAKTDPLTGAFNREGIGDAMRWGLAEWRRQGKPLSIVMLDLDHFKQINDTYGHAVGDRILAGVSALVKQNVRATDMFARWGGEEFVLVCRNTSLQEAQGVAQKLCRIISEHHFDEALDQQVSASFGVAQLRERESLDQIFERVDGALYKAKHKGRNRVVVSP